LFHRAILQSNAGFGLPPRTRTLDGERQRGEETTKLFGFDGDGAWQKLKSIAADELLARYEEHFPRYYHAPAVDGQLLQSPIWDTITAGQLADIPFIIGSNGDERYGGAPEDATEETVRKTIKETVYLDSPRSFAAVQSETDYREMIDRISTADGMLCPSQYTAALYGDAWVYYFARVREGDGGAAVRAYHGAELPYTFGTHPGWMTTTDVDRKLTDQILSYWTQFAATGNPNSPGLPEWPAFTGPDGAVMEFADEARAGAAQEPVLCRIFSESVKAPN
jgi:para-nitrobenzyl esterase